MGPRLRELRISRGLQQAEAARQLEISPAYLSLIETGKRTVQLPLLLRALELYAGELEAFMASLGEARIDAGLARLLDEPLLRSLELDQEDLASLGAEPKVVTTITALFNLYKNTRGQLDHLLGAQAAAGPARGSGPGSEGDPSADGLRFDYSPYDEVTDFLEAHRNWFPALEERAQALRQDARLGMRVSSEQLAAALEDQLGIRIRFVEEAGSVVRRWDPETQQLSLSSGILEQRAKFQIGVAAALRLFEVEQLHAPIVASDPPRHAETPRLLEIHLANYFAGALLLPYPAFFEQVQRRRYDVGRLAQIFESSYETVAHRLCNLSDPAQRGVPMHFLRVDLAGNISKRYSGDGIHFPHQHGSCPRMAVHLAFLSAHGIHRQYSRFPDGASYFCFAKVVGEPTRGSTARGTIYSIGIGARAEDAAHLAYADELPALSAQSAEAIAIPVGTTCRFCERSGCEMRSAPSYKHAFKVDAHVKKENFFSPLLRTDGEEGRPRARRRRER